MPTNKHRTQERGLILKRLLLNCVIDAEKLIPVYRNPFDRVAEGVESGDWSGRPDLNRGPLAPHASTLPGCATSRDLYGIRVRRV